MNSREFAVREFFISFPLNIRSMIAVNFPKRIGFYPSFSIPVVFLYKMRHLEKSLSNNDVTEKDTQAPEMKKRQEHMSLLYACSLKSQNIFFNFTSLQ